MLRCERFESRHAYSPQRAGWRVAVTSATRCICDLLIHLPTCLLWYGCSCDQKTDSVPGEVGKVLGQKWKALTAEDKKPYEDRAAEEKKKYEKAKAQYEAENPKDKKKGAAKKTKKPVTSDVCSHPQGGSRCRPYPPSIDTVLTLIGG